MRILVTRPKESAYPLITRLEELGFEVVLDPLIHITPKDPKTVSLPPPSDFEAIVTTSQQAIRCLAQITPHRDFPLWCVGRESTRVAQSLGFQDLHSGEGSSEDLLEKILMHFNQPPAKPLIHVSGDIVRLDMVKALHNKGFFAENILVYKTTESPTFSNPTQNALKDGTLQAVLFYSPRTGQIFQNICQTSQLENYCRTLSAICLSHSIEASISQLPWKDIRIAKKTTTEDLLSALMMAD